MFETVLSTNTDAVCLLRCGKFDESMYLLRAALVAVQAAGMETNQAQSQGPQGMIVSVPLNDEDIGSPGPRVNKLNCTSSVELFDKAFIFEGPQSLANTDENASLCAAVGMYNMALTMHLKALQRGSSQLLLKASLLYQKAFTVIHAMAPSPTSSISSLFLATVLNKIACEAELGGYCRVQEWRSVYSDMYAWATQFNEVTMEPEDLELFASNAVILSSSVFCTAPAA